MKKPFGFEGASLFLFILRLFFYLSVTVLPLLHPGIPVSYDRIGLVQWFIIIPVEAIIAFLPAFGGRLVYKGIFALAPLFLLSVWAGGFGPNAFPPFLAGLVSFILTFLLFHHPRFAKLSAAEPFLLAWVSFRLLGFSRSGEDAAGASMGLTQFILVWTAVVFLFHSVVIYFCLFPRSRGGAKGEALAFSLAAAAALVAVILILPADFVRNSVIANLLPDRQDRLSKPSDSDLGILDDGGGGRRQGRGTVPGDQSGKQPGLRGLSEHEWPGEGGRRRGSRGKNGSGGDGEEPPQYAVMVVASKTEPLYMGNSYRGLLDPVEGFLPSPEEPLNRLAFQRFFVTWFDNERLYDRGRSRREVFSLSTSASNFVPYRPYAIEPTVLSEDSGPFRYIHRTLSNMHPEDPLELVFQPGRQLSGLETDSLASYLEIPLNEADRAVFNAYLESVREAWQTRRNDILGNGAPVDNAIMETALAILLGFSEYQYNVNDADDSTIAALKDFLLNTKDGDCVEFSNTLALLGRLAGIPSRVVTGYLAAESLQKPAHLRGLAALRSKIPALQEFPFEDLYLVTDAHSHSWTQFYLPDYGWLDFDGTSFAIPPMGMGDANMRDVVIPLLDGGNKVFSQVRAFPWRAVLRALGLLALFALLAAYALRYGRELWLSIGTRRGGRQGARSLYLLLLSRLAAEGKPIKPASKTAAEYAELFPGQTADQGLIGLHFSAFATRYTELRWRTFPNDAETDECFRRLREEYRHILKAARRRTIPGFFIRIFSLRGLAYL